MTEQETPLPPSSSASFSSSSPRPSSSSSVCPFSTLGVPVPSLRIAILLNSYRSPFINEIRDSYVRTLTSVSPGSRLSFFYPADTPDVPLPQPDSFDLVIIGGSNVDPRDRCPTPLQEHERHRPWVLRVRNYIATVARDSPRAKMCGICWGHQTIALVFGGEVVDMAMPELGVTEVTLTAAGERFFKPQQEALTTCATSPPTTLRVQQHHRREVSVAPPEFVHLAADNQIFLSPNNNILTIQSHPEKDAQTAKLRIGDVRRWFPEGVGTEDEVIKRMELPHDGLAIWERILRWALEEG